MKENKLYSPVIEFELTDDNEIVEFEVGYTISPIRVSFYIWAALFKRDDYLYIKKLYKAESQI